MGTFYRKGSIGATGIAQGSRASGRTAGSVQIGVVRW